jgi:hypothetical protein
MLTLHPYHADAMLTPYLHCAETISTIGGRDEDGRGAGMRGDDGSYFNTIPTPFQHHFNTISTSFQHHSNTRHARGWW